MKRALIITAISLMIGIVVSSCNTYKRCPAYGGHSAVESTSILDKA